jgi:uncharacterized protein (DUF1697 family)
LRFAAFLRGINVGGHGAIRMADLKRAFERMGFVNVRTLLTSGNVVFDSQRSDRKVLTREIEAGLQELKQDIRVILRSVDDLAALRQADPFREIEVTPGIRLYFTFLAARSRRRTITLPFATAQNEFRILSETAEDVFSVLDLSKGKGTPDAMNVIEREYGSDVTTRNWNTVLKVLA